MAASYAAISVSELAASCAHVQRRRWRHGIGLCVSGGPDSMALAALFSKIKNSKLEFPASQGNLRHPLGMVKAFIIDHQAREGSAEEAEAVALRLTKIGLDTEILRIQWPPGIIPAQLPNFETRARTERYRILAQAAIRNNIPSLYLGHHQDDQVENFVMRLTGSDRGGRVPPSTALTGMRRSSQIPCCDDIYGATEQDPSAEHPDNGRVIAAHNGLTLVRPFLGYAKARLQATCESMEVQYVTDATNLDPTSTRRNAVRHLLTNHKLPRALLRSSLLQSQARITEKVSNFHELHGTALWRLLKVQEFDMKSGSLSILFPDQTRLGSEEACFTSIAYVLNDLLDAVSPKPRGPIAVAAEVIESVVKGLFQGAEERNISITRFVKTVAGVLIEPSRRVLRLSREPIRNSEQSRLTKTFVEAPKVNSIEGQSWTEWLFWDNRYWLRIKLGAFENASDYAVRPYRESDVMSVYTRLRKLKASGKFKRLIDSAATGMTKFTLPVIVKGGLVVGFPTLDTIVPGLDDHHWHEHGLLPNRSLPWESRYKIQIPLIQLACLRNGIEPMALRQPGKRNETGERSQRINAEREIAWLKTLKHDMPATEFERHCQEAQRSFWHLE